VHTACASLYCSRAHVKDQGQRHLIEIPPVSEWKASKHDVPLPHAVGCMVVVVLGAAVFAIQ
jgi:hypothetical protein